MAIQLFREMIQAACSAYTKAQMTQCSYKELEDSFNPNKNFKGYAARKELALTRRWPSAGRDAIHSGLFLGAKWAFWHYCIKQYSSPD